MKILCFDCQHECHCDITCQMDNGCGCQVCNHITIKSYEDYMGDNMLKKIKKVWQKVIDWLWK
jgi:hypothetical protein